MFELSAARRDWSEGHRPLGFVERLRRIDWSLVFLVAAIAAIGCVALYSVAGGSADPWMDRQIWRFALGLVLMLAIALVDLRYSLRLAYGVYAASLALLIYVEFFGATGMGAQRWLALGPLQVQPSELMKPALVLALARYFHFLPPAAMARPWVLIPPILLVGLPVLLVVKQPDLGTALILLLLAGIMIFLAGLRWGMIALILILAGLAAIYVWHSDLLHDYQKARLLTFLDPESDRQGAGYHIIQSKIALGSGGIWGRGFLKGTQSHLDFLPERHTDFIFTAFAEEFGFFGSLGLVLLYALLIGGIFLTALRARPLFGRLLAAGLGFNLFAYFFVNTAMVMGLIPVVGVPLPLVSYGGTAMLTVMIGFGLILAVGIDRDRRLGSGRDGPPG